MTDTRHRTWALLNGFLGILFGLLILLLPGISLITFMVLFALFAIASGLFIVGQGLFGRTTGAKRSWMVAGGILSLLAGILVFFWPGLTALILLYIIAARALVIGVLEIVTAFAPGKIHGPVWLLFTGIVNVLFAGLVFIFPGAGALALAWFIAAYVILAGIATVLEGFSDVSDSAGKFTTRGA